MRGKYCSQKCTKGHINWKGDNADYTTFHAWLKRMYGKANKCENSMCPKKSTNYQWALKKGKKYSHNKTHYFQLCIPCHKRYDLNRDVLKIDKQCL